MLLSIFLAKLTFENEEPIVWLDVILVQIKSLFLQLN